MMMKREYTAPAVEVLEHISEQMIAASGVEGNNGIGYGDVDEDGLMNAETRILFNEFLFE